MTLCEARAETLQRLLDGKGLPHPFSAMFPPITEEDFNKLVDDIEKCGLLQPIIIYQDKILDGNNRYRACMLAKVKPRFIELVEASDASAQRYIISANIHRRHLDPQKRKEILETLLKLDPTKSNRQLGEQTKLAHKTVGAVRAGLEATGEIPQLETTTGADGKKRKTKSGKTKGGKGNESEKVKIEYKKPIDTKTALKACNVLTGHLLDALEDLSEFSSFDHAETFAEQIKEGIDRKIAGLQPEETEGEEKEAA